MSDWAATNTLRERTTCGWEHDPPHPECIYCPAFEPYRAALALVEAALDAAWEELSEDIDLEFFDPDDPEIVAEYHRNFSEKKVAALVALRAVREGK